VKIYLERAYMDWWGVCVHDLRVAGGYACNAIHGVPFAASRSGVKNVSARSHFASWVSSINF